MVPLVLMAEKVCKKMGFQISKTDIENMINLVPGTTQRVLYYFYQKIMNYGPPAKNSSKVSPSKMGSQKINVEQESVELSEQLAEK